MTDWFEGGGIFSLRFFLSATQNQIKNKKKRQFFIFIF